MDIALTTLKTETREMRLAIEKLIELISLHDTNIKNIQIIQEFQTQKLNTLSKLNDMELQIKSVEQTMLNYNSRLASIEARLGLVELDSTSDHQLSGHNQEVVQDWLAEHEVGINTDMIPLNKQDIMERFQNHLERRKR